MYGRPFVPPDFRVPERLDGDGFHLRMLTIDDVDKDYEAVMASAARLRGLFGPASTWPVDLTKREDLIDLAWHHREFTLRRSFAYTVMSPDEETCLGCVYVFPTANPRYDAAVFYWARTGIADDRLEVRLGTLLRRWVESVWPFKGVAYPGRDITWEEWEP